MFKFTVTADGDHVVLVLDDYTDKPQTWIIQREAAAQMAELLAAAVLP